jgi:hypothetical protein
MSGPILITMLAFSGPGALALRLPWVAFPLLDLDAAQEGGGHSFCACHWRALHDQNHHQ